MIALRVKDRSVACFVKKSLLQAIPFQLAETKRFVGQEPSKNRADCHYVNGGSIPAPQQREILHLTAHKRLTAFFYTGCYLLLLLN